jgi:hypothetical protein
MPVAEIFFLMHSQPYANTREVTVCFAGPAVTKSSKGSDPHAIGCSLGSCRLGSCTKRRSMCFSFDKAKSYLIL